MDNTSPTSARAAVGCLQSELPGAWCLVESNPRDEPEWLHLCVQMWTMNAPLALGNRGRNLASRDQIGEIVVERSGQPRSSKVATMCESWLGRAKLPCG